MKVIPLGTKYLGMFAVVDDCDYVEMSKHEWYFNSGYNQGAAYRQFRENGKRRTVLMHRDIIKLSVSIAPHIDHRNGNKLDNQRINLRPCTHAQNLKNQKRRVDNTSGFKGVSFFKPMNKWAAQIQSDGKRVTEYYADKLDAARAYNRMATELHGQFARLNDL